MIDLNFIAHNELLRECFSLDCQHSAVRDRAPMATGISVHGNLSGFRGE